MRGEPRDRRKDDARSSSAKLPRGELAKLLLISVPALGLSLAATTLNAYVPVLARDLTQSSFVAGVLVSGEGIVALAWAVWIGAASDRVKTRFGPRLPFMIAAAPIAALALIATPLAQSMAVLAGVVTVYYVAYYSYYAPYRALQSDLVPRGESGRVNGIQGVFRGAGMGAGLVGGALLFHLWRPLPYGIAAALLVATTAVAVIGLRRQACRDAPDAPGGSMAGRIWTIVRDHADIRRFIAANLLWQLTEAGLRAFIVLYLTQGLHESFSFAALAMSVVMVAALVAAPIAGKLADRYGPMRVMRVMLVVFGVGLWVATFTRSTAWLLAELPFVGIGGAMALSLPYAILMRMMPRESHGASAGLFDVSSGAGSLLGPILVGAAIDVLHPLFASTNGYAAMWPVLGTATLLSLVFMRTKEPEDAKRHLVRSPEPSTP